jgi:beta-glucanase (GH16 family)
MWDRVDRETGGQHTGFMQSAFARLFLAFTLAVTAGLFLARSLAADPDDPKPDQFKFTGGEQPLGDTALHKNWKLVWEDDFSKDKQIDTGKWNLEINGHGGGNGELEYYTANKKNASIIDGELVITALKDDDGHKYTSARITTSRKFSCRYGRIEACIKAPTAQAGNWPAFWMMPQDNKYGPWPRSGEIDIMELINKSDKLYGTCHYGGEKGDVHSGAQAVIRKAADYSMDYHVYAVEWEASEIRWYVDGTFYGSIHTWQTAAAAYPAPFDQKFFIILNYAIGGAWPHSPDANSTFPQSMHVRYVRVYQP